MTLRLRLLFAIGLSLALLWSGSALWMVRDLDRGLQRTLDERLEMSARMVAGLLAQPGDGGTPAIPARNMLTVPAGRGMACQIRSLRGEVIATTSGAGRAPLAAGAPGFRTAWVDGRQWRTYTLRTEGFDITTADRVDERVLLRRRIALAAGAPFLLAMVGGLLVLWFGAGRALAPLSGLQRMLASRNPDATDPVDGNRFPGELRPLIGALNGLLERMGLAIQRERHFTNDAAHELRTPLTVIDTHLQLARLTAGESAGQALSDAAIGVERMRSTLDQLLMLARVEGALPFDDGTCITAPEALERAIALAQGDAPERIVVASVPGDTGTLDVPPQLAVVALRNLIDNALRYSPPGSPVDVCLVGDRSSTCFRVADRGPGMNEVEAQSATRRFWRGKASSGGSGLGLALVEAIASRFGGSLSLARRQPHGLVAELVLPSRRPTAAGEPQA